MSSPVAGPFRDSSALFGTDRSPGETPIDSLPATTDFRLLLGALLALLVGVFVGGGLAATGTTIESTGLENAGLVLIFAAGVVFLALMQTIIRRALNESPAP